MSEITSPLARLVVFMVCLSVAGTFIAGLHYLAIDKPSQDTTEQPLNELGADCGESCILNRNACLNSPMSLNAMDESLCESGYQACLKDCLRSVDSQSF